MDDAATQCSVLGIGHQIFFRDQNAIGKANLFLSFFLLIKRLHTVFGIDDGDNRIEAVVLGDIIVHKKRLANRARVGHPCSLNNDAFKLQRTAFVTLAQVNQGAHQIATDGAAYAAVGQLDDFFFLILDE